MIWIPKILKKWVYGEHSILELPRQQSCLLPAEMLPEAGGFFHPLRQHLRSVANLPNRRNRQRRVDTSTGGCNNVITGFQGLAMVRVQETDGRLADLKITENKKESREPQEQH
jgi:hypothetical protein